MFEPTLESTVDSHTAGTGIPLEVIKLVLVAKPTTLFQWVL